MNLIIKFKEGFTLLEDHPFYHLQVNAGYYKAIEYLQWTFGPGITYTK